jgi:1A family penicillin-binding protein
MVFLLIAVLLAVGFIFGTIIMLRLSSELPDPNKLSDRPIAQSTKIYDRTGQHLLREVYQDQKRTLVELNDISPFVTQAVVATEDKHFYEHKGIRILSIIRAGFNNMIGRRTGSGGASTLTQQLIKNVLVGDERTFFRKIKEALLAIKAEQQYSKEQILKLYLNEIPFGSTNYGIESASQSYFQKSAKNLTLPEAATLAGIIKKPSMYLNDPEALKNRRDVVLRLMKEQGYISEEEKTQAQNSPLNFNRGKGILEAPHFVFYVEDQLQNILGKNDLATGGYKIFTSLDFDKQKTAEAIVKENGDKFAKENNANNAALVAMDPKTGQILAMVGSRDYYNNDIDGQFNAALSRNRQPGSSLKPFVYLAAFEKGFTPETVLYDVRVHFDKSFFPKNATNQEYGQLTMRKALQGSLNIPAVKTMYLVGYDETIDYLTSRFGYTTLKDAYYGLSLVLGGAQIVPLEHTAAYAALANNGTYLPPQSILKIENDHGEVIYQAPAPEGREAVKPELAALMSNILSDNQARAFIFGNKNNLTLPDRPVAAKTGTTNDNKDAWTMGYVPSLAVGVWVGNTKPSSMRGGGEGLAGIIWNQFMKAALKNVPPENFPTPPTNDSVKPILHGVDGGLKLKINSTNGKIATSSTPPELIVEKTFLVPHDILFYVDKKDPAGPEPLNPQDDPQFQSWEDALQAWVKKQQEQGKNITLDPVPTEYDDALEVFNEFTPKVEILSPQEGGTLTDRNLEIKISASALRGVTQVNFKIDGASIGNSTQPPFTFTYFAQNLGPGEHTLTVTAVDDQGNWGTKQIKFILTPEVGSTNFDWINSSPLSLSTDQFPFEVSVMTYNWDNSKDLKIYLISSGEEKLIYTFDQNDTPVNNKLSFMWKRIPKKGSLGLKGIMKNKQGELIEKTLSVEIK